MDPKLASAGASTPSAETTSSLSTAVAAAVEMRAVAVVPMAVLTWSTAPTPEYSMATASICVLAGAAFTVTEKPAPVALMGAYSTAAFWRPRVADDVVPCAADV